jgi:phosphatidylglycerophosphate synthase
MVRREEQHWRNTATLFLDTRRLAHGTAASFELAVSAAASIGVHLAADGFDARLATEAGLVPRQGPFHDALLDTLAVVRPSRSASLHGGISALRAAGGQIIAVLGSMTQEEATELAATRSGSTQAMALVLGSSPLTVQILASTGWRAVLLTADTSLAAAWQQLHQMRGTVNSP